MRAAIVHARKLANSHQSIRWFVENTRAWLKADPGRSQASLAAGAGCNKVYLSNVLTGKCSPSLAFVGSIADAMEVPCEDLIGNPKKFRVHLDA